MIVLVLALPLTCWGLAARRARAGWIVAVVLAVLLYGSPASVPPAGVLPLPAGVAVTSNRSQGCSAGSQTYCTRHLVA